MDKIQQKLDHIYDFYENQVTRIYERKELLLLYDLAYHSILQFDFMSQPLTRGWVEVLVVGDTRCGKTKTAQRLLQHYRAGEMGTGENTSIAGLIGGMQQVSHHWSIIWGKLPRNDRRLVIIDEASNLPVETISNFATIRSEGIARITKIQTEQTYSRTRAIWISNPRVSRSGIGRPIAAYDYGVLTIPELIGRQADVARFDVATVVANGEVSSDIIFRTHEPKNGSPYTSDIAHSLVMWCWSRKSNHVQILKETEQEIIHQAKNLAKRYHDSIPLIKLEELPEKLARLSTAIAGRLFSSPDGINLVVYPSHTAFICSFLNKIYSKPSMGYYDYSKKWFNREVLPDVDNILDKIMPYGMDFIQGLLEYQNIRQVVIEDLTGLERDQVRPLISFMVRKKCLRPEHVWYRKTEAFIKLLKEIEMGKFKIKEEEF